MKTTIMSALFTLCVLLMAGCSKTADDDTAATVSAIEAPAGADDQHFSFTIDGEPMHIAVADIYVSLGYGDTLKVFAGAERKLSVTLTVPNVTNCPCVVPAGATAAGDELTQGSVSLQHYPNPGNGLNNWYLGLDGTPPDHAIEITDIGTIVDGARYISGTFDTTVLKTQSNGDGPENRDYVVAGTFRLRFETTGVNGF